MVKAKASDVKKKLQEEQEEIYGDQDNAVSVDDVDETYKKTFGHKPIKGEILADEVAGAEKLRRGKKPHKRKRS